MTISNLEEAFSFQRKMMLALGFWPKRNSSFIYKLYGTVVYLIIAAFAASLWLACLYLKEFSELIQSWAMFVSIFNCCLKFAMFVAKMPTCLELLDFLESPHFKYYDDDLDVHVKRSIKVASTMVRLFLVSALMTVSSFAVSPLTAPKPRVLPLPFAFDMSESPFALYMFVYVFQSGALFMCGWLSTGHDNLAISMMALAAGYFKILKVTILRTTDPQYLLGDGYSLQGGIIEHYSQFDRDINRKLYRCVEHHLAVIRFTEYIESIFSYVILMQFIASAASLCLAGFTFANAPVGSYEFIFALSLLTTLMFQISLYCVFGNEITVHSARISDACYMTEWIGCGPKVCKTLFLIMERSKRPLILTAGKFINLSLSSLVAVFRSAISYGAVLRQLYHK